MHHKCKCNQYFSNVLSLNTPGVIWRTKPLSRLENAHTCLMRLNSRILSDGTTDYLIHVDWQGGQFVFTAVVSGACGGVEVGGASWRSEGRWVTSPLWQEIWVGIVTNACPPHHHHWEPLINAPKALTALWALHCGGPQLRVCRCIQG